MYYILLVTIMKSVLIFVLVLFLVRIMGRKVISQITFFDFIIGISMGAIIAHAIITPEYASLTAALALIVFTILERLTGYLHLKSIVIRKLVNSKPSTLIESGSIIEPNMKNMKLTINELMMKLREKSVFNLADVEFAIMEPDGELSVLLKSQKKPLTPHDLNIKTPKSVLTRDVIIDGNIMTKNLISVGLDENWVKTQLNNHGIKSVSEVFYAGLDTNNKLHISKKNNKVNNSQDKYGIE